MSSLQGRILLWQNYKDTDKNTSLHWHSHAVGSLKFSSDGDYLISGGKEAVLVIWQLESGEKKYLPRLGSSISFITSSFNDSHYAISCEDNSIKIVSGTSFQVVKAMQGFASSKEP
jgi:NET1-associated nuclear protein 1 (U3 small nucleolar RNA-associated protein 17)